MATQGSRQQNSEQENNDRQSSDQKKKPAEERNRDMGKGTKPEPLPGQTDGVENGYAREKDESRQFDDDRETQPSQKQNVNRTDRPGDAIPGDDEETSNRTRRTREGIK